MNIRFVEIPSSMPGVSLVNAVIDGSGVRISYTEGTLDTVDLKCIKTMFVMASPKVCGYLVTQIMSGNFPTVQGRAYNRLLFYAHMFHRMGAVINALTCLRAAHTVAESASERNLVRSLLHVYMKGPELTLEQKLLTPKQIARSIVVAAVRACNYIPEAEPAFA